MEVTGRISVEPTEDLRSTRLQSLSVEDMHKELTKLKDDQSKSFKIDNTVMWTDKMQTISWKSLLLRLMKGPFESYVQQSAAIDFGIQ